MRIKNVIKYALITLGAIAVVSGVASSASIFRVHQGGTGTSTAPSIGELLIGNAGNTYDVATLTAGTNVTIVEGDGSITINSTATGGGGGSNWSFDTTYGESVLTTTSSIPIWAKDTIYASSTLRVDGNGYIPNLYTKTMQATDGNSIQMQPDGDTDDFFSFHSPSDRPTFKREGGKFIYIASSNVYDMGLSFRENATYSGTLNYEKDNHRIGIVGKAVPFYVKVNEDYDDYFLFQTASNLPELTVVSSTGLKINAGGTNALLLNDSGGSVGIATTTPGETFGEILTVVGDSYFVGNITTTSFGINSETFTDLTGTGLQNTAGSLQTTLGTSIDISTETNLGVSSPITLTDDTVGFDYGVANTWTNTNTFNVTTTLATDLVVDTNTLFVDSFNSRVGIGTVSLVEKLYVQGADNSTGIEWAMAVKNPHNSGTTDPFGVGIKLRTGGTSETAKWGGIAAVSETAWSNGQGLALYANELERVRIDSSGDVGIGTSTPWGHLSVEGQGSSPGLVVSDNADNTDFIVDADGRVGIGTITPEGKFHLIESSEDEPRGITVENIFEGPSGPLVFFQKARGTIGSPTAVQTNDALGAITFRGYDDVGYSNHHEAYIIARADENFTFNTNYGSRIEVNVNQNANGYNPYEHTIFESDGTLSIEEGGLEAKGNIWTRATATPYIRVEGSTDGKLQIGDTGANSTQRNYEIKSEGNKFRVSSVNDDWASYNTENAFVIKSDGTVGIGTDAPEEKLHISGGDILLDNTESLKIKDSGGDDRIILRLNADNTTDIGGSNAALSDIKLNVGGVSNALVIKETTGNVGIATTTPQYELTVAGDIMGTGGLYDNAYSAGTNGYVLQSDGSGFNWVATSTLGISGAGTVTSVDMSVPTGLAISGNPITTAGTLALGLDTGYVIPTSTRLVLHDTAYGWGDWNTNIDISTDTNLVAGTNITLSGDTLNVDDAFLLLAGDSSSGNYTFTGVVTSTNFAIENSSDGTKDVQFSVDTDGDVNIIASDITAATTTMVSGGFDFGNGTNGMRIIVGSTTTLEFY